MCDNDPLKTLVINNDMMVPRGYVIVFRSRQGLVMESPTRRLTEDELRDCSVIPDDNNVIAEHLTDQ